MSGLLSPFLHFCREVAILPDMHAIMIGVSGYSEELGDLAFAPRAVSVLARVLKTHFGYTTTTMIEPGMSGAEIDKAVEDAIETARPGTTLLVHILAHGHQQDSGHLYALGTDLARKAEVGTWLQRVYARREPITVLFLLDMCRSGTAARLDWLGDYAGDGQRGWVLAACTEGELAYNGNFTVALANVLRDAASEHAVASSAHRFLSLAAVARAVRAETERLRLAQGNWKQVVTGSLIDIADLTDLLGSAAFFPHPARALGPAETGTADLTALPFLDELDEGMDARHFIACATGAGGFAEPGRLAGCFTGREKQLGFLTSWLVGGGSPLAVVTGGPGAGKSALLGVLVCAAHPRLRDGTAALWSVAAATPPTLPRPAVVNCRGRGLAEIAASLGRQLGLPEGPDLLLDALARGTGVRIVVADALDEAADPAGVASWLGDLARTTLPDGRGAVRLLAATRAEPETRGLLDLARSRGHLVDLDAVEPEVLGRDLHSYITQLIRSTGVDTTGAVTGVFATAVSTALASAGGGHGEFLVAGIHTRRFLDSFHPEGLDEAERIQEALRFGRRVRPSPVEAFRADLEAGRDPWLRAALTALAHARADGMPLSVLTRAARVFGASAEPPGRAEIRAALDSRGFYLRRSVDGEGMTLYRLFHEELIGYLREADGAAGLPEALLDSLGPSGARVWGAAEPYVLRHVLDHAAGTPLENDLLADPGFLLRAAPEALAACPAWEEAPLRRLLPAAGTFEERRAAFALAAAAVGEHTTGEEIASLPGEPPLAWRPIWSRAHRTAPTAPEHWHTAVLLANRHLLLWGTRGTEEIKEVTAFTFVRHEGATALVTGHADGRITLRTRGGDREPRAAAGTAVSSSIDLPRPDGDTRIPGASAVTSLAALETGGSALVFGGWRSGRILGIDLSAGSASEQFPDPPARGTVRIAVQEEPPTLVRADGTGDLATRDLRSGPGRHEPAGDRHPARAPRRSIPHLLSFALVAIEGRTTLVAGCGDGVIRIFDHHTHSLLKTLELPGLGTRHFSECGVACGLLDGRAVGVHAGPDGEVRVFDILVGEFVTSFQTGLGPLWSVSVRRIDGRLFCLPTGARGAGVWELGREGAEPVCALTDLPSTAGALTEESVGPDGLAVPHWGVAAGRAGDRSVLVLSSHDGTLRCLDAATGEEVLPALPPLGKTPVRLETADLAGTPVAMLHTTEDIRIWNLLDGSEGLIPRPRGRTQREDSGAAHVFAGGRLVSLTGDSQGRILCDGERLGEQGAPVTALTGARIGGRPCAVSGGADGSVLVVDLETRRTTARLALGAPVRGLVHTPEDILIAVTGLGTVAFRRGQR